MWDWIVNILFELLKLIQTFAVDWGLSIIILVVIIRLLLTPLMLKSTKSTARMQVLQPKMLEIQERYADDPQRQAEEMQKFYSENKFNPMAGCLPLLIQMPVLFALFTLLRNLPDYFNDGTFSFFNILPDLTTTPSASFADGFMVALPALICLILFAVLTLIPQLYMSRNQTGQQAQQGRLATAGRAQQRHAFPRAQLQANILQHRYRLFAKRKRMMKMADGYRRAARYRLGYHCIPPRCQLSRRSRSINNPLIRPEHNKAITSSAAYILG